MDEFNKNIDPTNEYPSVDFQNESNTTQSNDEVKFEQPQANTTQADDVFEAFEKAKNETPIYNAPQNEYPSAMPVNPYNEYKEAPPTVPHKQPYTPPYQQPQYNVNQPTVPYGTPYNQQPYNGAQYRNQQPYQNGQPYQNQQPYNTQPNPYAPPQYQSPQRVDQNYNPYMAQNQFIKPKEKTPKGTKVLIGILIALLVVFMIAFFVSCTAAVYGDKDVQKGDNPLSQFATEPFIEEFIPEEYYDFYNGFGIEEQYKGETFDEKITLQSDEGHTQIKDTDKDQNSYPPNEEVKDLTAQALPKDKDNAKYTTQSAYNTVTDSVVSIMCYEDKITDNVEDILGEGTGTIVSQDGYIITNSHVIGDSKQYAINVILSNSKEYRAKVVGYDSRTDLAVLKIDAKDLSFVTFGDSNLVEVGQDIVAIGSPGGQSFQNSLTKGIVSAVDRELDLSQNVTYIQLDAAINPGNSGGPLCNIYGQVIGINTAKISSAEYEGMGFAIPSETVIDIANDLIHYGYVKDRVRLGLTGTPVDEEMKYSYNVPNGILITEIQEDGPLDGTNIQPYDILTEIDGKKVESFQDVYGILENYKPGDKVKLTLYRLEY